MNIGLASDQSGVTRKTIRYYEEIGLILPERHDNGYRDYDDADIHKLKFLKRSRGLGFSIEECRTLMSLYEDQHRSSSEVKTLASQKLIEIDTKIEELMGLKNTLSSLINACHGDDRPDCPILDDLAGEKH